MKDGIVLHFACRTTTPFHTTRMEYANLVKCAPYILGSTIRGALLKRLLERGLCSHLDALDANDEHTAERLAAIHRAPPCLVAPFFPSAGELPNAYFSFGQFAAEQTSLYRSTTRIALERPFGSVSEGALVTIEAIAPNAAFDFEIVLFEETQGLEMELIDATHETAKRGEGLGRYRSIGYGQFEIDKVTRERFAERVEDAEKVWEKTITSKEYDNKKTHHVSAQFESPYVLRGDGALPSFQTDEFSEYLRVQLQNVLRDAGMDATMPPLSDARPFLKPDFVSRFSYEIGSRSNRLVTREGSGVEFSFAENEAAMQRALACASVLGIGEWNAWGFGKLIPASNATTSTARAAAREMEADPKG